MKAVGFVLLVLLTVQLPAIAPADTVSAESGYYLKKGESWNLRSSDGSTVRSLDKICNPDSCYQLQPDHYEYRRVERRYGLNSLGFEVLARLPGAALAGEKLMLPNELGSELFRIARFKALGKFLEFDWRRDGFSPGMR